MFYYNTMDGGHTTGRFAPATGPEHIARGGAHFGGARGARGTIPHRGPRGSYGRGLRHNNGTFFRARLYRWNFPWWFYGGYYYPWWFAYRMGQMDEALYQQYAHEYEAPPSDGSWGPVPPPKGAQGYAAIPANSAIPFVTCDICGKYGKDLGMCGSCFTVYYCGADCQASDAAEHKVHCEAHQ